MTGLIVRIVTRGRGVSENRERLGKTAGIVGVVSNLLLAGLKFLIGLMTGSVAITADAANNISDCASSVVTLLGFRLAELPPDEEHPWGHARYEYISGLVVTILVLLIGFEFLKNSIQKIIHPEPVGFSVFVIVVLAASILIKLWQGLFNKKVGTLIESPALAATAADSMNDVISTGVVLIAALVQHVTGWLLDGWMGLLVAVFVIISGIRLVGDTLNPLIGQAPDAKLVQQLTEKILSYPSVAGIHDLMIHNYGPGRCFASAHVEVPANQDIMCSHDLIDTIERDILQNMDIQLVVHMDPIVTDDDRINRLRAQIAEMVLEIDPVLSIHDFRMVEGSTHTNLIFDVVTPPRYRMSDRSLRETIQEKVSGLLHGTYYCIITVDRSYIHTSNKEGD